MSTQKTFGLIGYPLSHSFSKKYFTEKFSKDNRYKNYSYENFELRNISEFIGLINERTDLFGLNVTIPYKETVIPFLDALDKISGECGAVNTILIERQATGRIHTKGFNTDVTGFSDSIKPLLQEYHSGAVILGTGGASKAISYALKEMNLPFILISRSKIDGLLSYSDLTADLIKKYPVIINTTPLGSFPAIDTFPAIPYEFLTDKNLLFDLVYNPAETRFLLKGRESGAITVNGYDMLTRQAEAAFRIWENF